MPAISGTIDPPSMPGLDEGWVGGVGAGRDVFRDLG